MSNAIVTQKEGWNRLWRLAIPHKIKVFLWRFCRNNVPVRNRLKYKGVALPITCPMCNRDVEHLLHVFFDCQFASQCWDYAGLNYNMQEVYYAPDWLIQKINEGTVEEVGKIAIVLWGVWFWRNKKVWKGKTVSPQLAVDWSTKIVRDWRLAMANKNNCGSTTSRGRQQETEKWQAPEYGSFKVNVDASFQEGSESFSVGMVLRDHTGTFIEGKVMSFPSPESVFAAESIGMCEALSWIANRGLQNVMFESDSLLTVKALQNREDNQLEVGHILSSCLVWLAENPSFVVSFVRRHVNKVAHTLAKCPCFVNCYNLFTSPPDLLLETLMFDYPF